MIQDKINMNTHDLAVAYIANKVYGDTLIKELERRDRGLKRSRHKESIKFIKRFNTTYELGAEEYLPTENQVWLGIKEGFAFLAFLIGICAVLTLIAAVMT